MNIKVPPPIVMFVFGGLMYGLDAFLPVGEFDFFGRRELQYFAWSLAAFLMLMAFWKFRKARTTTNPIEPLKAKKLVINGIYKYTRNPMYLAMLLILIGFGLKLGNAFNTITAAAFVYYMNHFQIRREEEALTKLFGKEYRLYLKATRRWF
ncbi:methyltransferase family protein [Croceitalea rosinachiae]|uniref:Isoprenylcysteine carboxylmethyltransferase family protein n=1 Tax=Croceitalea rosinachiae TaxID=3075596 RepID=A0ABU3ABC6_9FLAO|nr:isoprenylcysteine carboxylmethyltransferase family protein [Croceitalea sp. F388]MDT0607218.1 isoprenylcysteine carboxylmethyltransferase family protein [Croceitalea sp. F388]